MEETIVMPRFEERDVTQILTARFQNARDFLHDKEGASQVLCHRSGVNKIKSFVSERQEMCVTKNIRATMLPQILQHAGLGDVSPDIRVASICYPFPHLATPASNLQDARSFGKFCENIDVSEVKMNRGLRSPTTLGIIERFEKTIAQYGAVGREIERYLCFGALRKKHWRTIFFRE